MSKKSKLQLHIVLDTNALFTEAADALLNQATADLIKQSREHSDLDVFWHLPTVVRGERQYQMRKVAVALLPQIRRLERLLGHGLAISEEILEDRVDKAIDRHMKDLGLSELPLVNESVDWQALIKNALFRKPPFDAGEKEKGFRDALVVESFVQLAEKLPKAPASCRVFLLTRDNLMKMAVEERTSARANVRILSELDDLKAQINTLASQLTDELLAAILPQASQLFFVKDNEDSLWNKEKLGAKIPEMFKGILSKGPEAGMTVSTKQIQLGGQTFLRKKGQQVEWSCKITYLVEARSYQLVGGLLSGIYSASEADSISSFWKQHKLGGAPENTAPRPVSERAGTHIFEAVWKCTLTVSQKLRNPKLTKIEHLESIWAEPKGSPGSESPGAPQ